MIEFPSHDTIEVLRSLIQLCKNEGVTQIKLGPVELSFRVENPIPTPQSFTPEERAKFEEDMAMRRQEDMFAASGFVPNIGGRK